MQRTKKLINFAQTFAAICLGISCFLPFYMSAAGEIRYAKGEWGLFFWVIPVLFIIYKLSNRWLIAVLCFLSAIGGLLDLFVITFLATFKSTPLIGFHIAKISIVILVISWLALCAISLWRPQHKQTSN
jgi:hypothetical protein